MLDELPPKFQHGPSDVRLDRNDLADYWVRHGGLRLLFLPLHLLHPILEGTRSPRVLRKDLLMARRDALFAFRVSLVEIAGHASVTTLAGASLPLVDIPILERILVHRTVIFFEQCHWHFSYGLDYTRPVILADPPRRLIHDLRAPILILGV